MRHLLFLLVCWTSVATAQSPTPSARLRLPRVFSNGMVLQRDVRIPVWGWGPRARPTDHLDPLGAARAVELIRPRVAVPIHWGTLHPIGMRWVRPNTRIDPPHAFARYVAELVPGTVVHVIPIGGRLVIGAGTESVDDALD